MRRPLTWLGIVLALLASTNADTTSNGPTRSHDTNVAMIVLYSVTGCVSLGFCIIIISGAYRAIRYPERYGPRARGHGESQSRARGLTRAILDTFPIVKFGPSRELDKRENVQDLEAHLKSSGGPDMTQASPTQPTLHAASRQNLPSQPTNSIVPLVNSDSEVIPAAIGRETCPICIIDFEEGDDLRVLPCDGAHRFHKDCVDPWLLELSTACPICRHDFFALETMIAGSSLSTHDSSHRSSRLHRFSRYLRFARHGRDETRDSQTDFPGDVPG